MGVKLMRAMVLDRPGEPLRRREIEIPSPAPEEVLVKVRACGVCRTDLHVVDGELPGAKLPLVPGHEIVGEVAAVGDRVEQLTPGQAVGVPWLGYTCGACGYWRRGRENLCDAPEFTGYTRDGGYAEYTVAHQHFVFPLAGSPTPAVAPLLCAGLIGYRSLRLAGDAEHLGLYGFGAAAHIVAQLARHQGRHVYAFTRAGDTKAQDFARALGAVWAGASGEAPPRPLDAAILYAPIGDLVPIALRAIRKGGTVVCAGIHMSDIPSFPYRILWGERTIRSVANLTRRDGDEFLVIAPKVPIETTVEEFALDDANEALRRLRAGEISGAAVLVP